MQALQRPCALHLHAMGSLPIGRGRPHPRCSHVIKERLVQHCGHILRPWWGSSACCHCMPIVSSCVQQDLQSCRLHYVSLPRQTALRQHHAGAYCHTSIHKYCNFDCIRLMLPSSEHGLLTPSLGQALAGYTR